MRRGGKPSWFDILLGFPESPENVRKFLSVGKSERGGLTLSSSKNGTTFEVGDFQLRTVESLREEATAAKRQGRLKVSLEVGDIQKLLSNPAYKYATVQVASQFNCLEFPSYSAQPEDGVSVYERDRTQGPACSISCGAATVFRNYFCLDGAAMAPQTAQRQIENFREAQEVLGSLGRCVDIRNGYSLSDPEALKELNKGLAAGGAALEMEFVSKLKIGIHFQAQVTASDWGQTLCPDPDQRVTQAFCSACACAYSQGDKSAWEPIARLVLRGAYVATLATAIVSMKRHSEAGLPQAGENIVLLTLLGGGVFGNDLEWIADAIHMACSEFQDVPLDVRIVCFRETEATASIHALCQTFTG
jgi:hypothetical protein